MPPARSSVARDSGSDGRREGIGGRGAGMESMAGASEAEEKRIRRGRAERRRGGGMAWILPAFSSNGKRLSWDSAPPPPPILEAVSPTTAAALALAVEPSSRPCSGTGREVPPASVRLVYFFSFSFPMQVRVRSWLVLHWTRLPRVEACAVPR
jgi:hypothetical protein